MKKGSNLYYLWNVLNIGGNSSFNSFNFSVTNYFIKKKTFIIDLLLRYVFEVNCFRIFKQDSQVLLQATLMVAGLSGSVG